MSRLRPFSEAEHLPDRQQWRCDLAGLPHAGHGDVAQQPARERHALHRGGRSAAGFPGALVSQTLGSHLKRGNTRKKPTLNLDEIM